MASYSDVVAEFADAMTEAPLGQTTEPNHITVTNGSSSYMHVYNVSADMPGGSTSVDVPSAPVVVPPGEAAQVGSVSATPVEPWSGSVTATIQMYATDGRESPEEPLDDILINWEIIVGPGVEPPEEEPEEEPGEEAGSPVYVAVFTSSSEDGGGGTTTTEAAIPLITLGSVSPSDVALALIPVYEDAGWSFKHIRKTSQHVKTYDPRNA